MKSKTMMDYFQQIETYLTKADIYSAKVMAGVSVALIEKRISLKMSQKEFSEFLHVTQGMVSRWESGTYNFTINTIAEIAEKIGYTFDILLEDEDADVRSSYLKSEPNSDYELQYGGAEKKVMALCHPFQIEVAA